MKALIKRYAIVAIACVVVIAVWCVWFRFALSPPQRHPQIKALDKLGQLGDTFGAINALFTGLALVGLVYTIVQQQKQIQQQEADSHENHQNLARQKGANSFFLLG